MAGDSVSIFIHRRRINIAYYSLLNRTTIKYNRDRPNLIIWRYTRATPGTLPRGNTYTSVNTKGEGRIVVCAELKNGIYEVEKSRSHLVEGPGLRNKALPTRPHLCLAFLTKPSPYKYIKCFEPHPARNRKKFHFTC